MQAVVTRGTHVLRTFTTAATFGIEGLQAGEFDVHFLRFTS